MKYDVLKDVIIDGVAIEKGKSVDQFVPSEAISAGLLALARAILSDRDNEITCAECVSWLPTCVEDAQNVDPDWYPFIEQHLTICPSCAMAYVSLSEVVDLVDSGSLTEPPSYPQFLFPRSKIA